MSALPALIAALAAPQLPPASRTPQFERVVLDTVFRSEGVATADFDLDGDLDVFAGELVWLAPAWTPVAIAPPGNYDPAQGYADCFIAGATDVDGDGWPDALVVGFPGGAAHWYRNPQGAPGSWAKHLIAPAVSNESPHFTDVDGDGRLDLLGGIEAQQQLAWFEPRADPTQPWSARTLSQPGEPGWEQFHHGLGRDDVDGDGRLDVLTTLGWWRAPANPGTAGAWSFRPASWQGSSAFGPQMAAQIPAFDVDGDGDADVVTSSPHAYGLWWWERAGDAWIEHGIADDVSQTHALVAADLDGDGDRDLVTGKRWYAHGPSGDPGSQEPALLEWFELVRGAGSVEWRRHVIDRDSGIGTQFEVVDVDANGSLDVVVANKKGVFVFRR